MLYGWLKRRVFASKVEGVYGELVKIVAEDEGFWKMEKRGEG